MMQTTLSFAKTTQPTLSLVVERERLFEMLDEAGDKPAVWIAGPPGSGKTTAIASYLSTRKRVTLWYQVDSADADVATFFHYLRRTAIKHGDGQLTNLPELPSESANWAGFAKRLFREIYAGFRGSLVIVLDNYDALPTYIELNEILSAAIDEVPRQSKLVFVSRTGPPPTFARHLLNGKLVRIDGDDLRLSLYEFEQLAELRHANLDAEARQAIYSVSSGWMAGCVMMIEYTRGTPQFAGEIADGTGSVLFDYIAQEVFATFDSTTRDFLLSVCWPRQLSAEMAEAISGESTAQHILGNLARNNYFVTERGVPAEREYILHPLLREFLQARAHELLNHDQVSESCRNSAKFLAAAGHPEEAVELLSENLDWERLELVITEHAKTLARQGRISMVAKWLEELPPDRLEANPWLLYWFGKSRQPDSAREARNAFARAYRRFSDAETIDRTGMVLAATGVIEAIIEEADDYSLLDDWVTSITGLVESKPDEDALQHISAVVLLAALLRNPKRVDVEMWFRWSEDMLENITNPAEQRRYAVMLGFARMLSGQFDWADELTARYRSAFTDEDRTGMRCKYLLVSGMIALLRSADDEATAAAQECIKQMDENAVDNLRGFACAMQCAAAMMNADLDTADSWLETLKGLTSPAERVLVFLLNYLGSWRVLIENDAIEALHRQREAQKAAVELGIVFLEILSSIACAQLLFLCGDKRAGTAQLRRVHSMARDVDNPLLEFLTLLIYGSVAIEGGKATSGGNALRYALGLGRQHACYAIPWWNPAQLADVCAIALREKIETKYVQKLVIRRKLQPSRPPFDIPDWPWTLSITTLGGFSVSKFGELDKQTSEGRGRPLYLLKILLALGAQHVRAGDVAGVLWPHVEDEYGSKSLTINLHRLRRILGHDDVIIFRDGALTLDPRMVAVDAFAVERIVGDIESRSHDVQPWIDDAEIEVYAQRLLELYRGPFLPDLKDQPCVTTARARYREMFCKGICLLTDAQESSGHRSSAIGVAAAAITLDPAAETLSRNLMRMYRDSGQIGEALATFDRCRTAVVTEGGVSISEATAALYATLKASEGDSVPLPR